MAENQVLVKEESIPTWNCKLDPKTGVTVGQKLILSCQGFDEIATGKSYELINDQGDPYVLHLLKVRKDNPMTKEFIVTPYRVYKKSLVLTFKDKQSDTRLFQSKVNEIQIESVIKNKADAQMVGPQGPSWVLFTPLEFGFLILALIVSIGYSVFKAYKRQKRRRDYKKIMKLVNYEDPFLDLNVDILSIERDHKKTQNLKPYIESALKKFFYHFFNKPVFFDTPTKMDYELKRLKILDHDMRAIGVIKNDFEKILNNVDFDIEAKKDFLQSIKKSINRLKRYDKGSRL